MKRSIVAGAVSLLIVFVLFLAVLIFAYSKSFAMSCHGGAGSGGGHEGHQTEQSKPAGQSNVLPQAKTSVIELSPAVTVTAVVVCPGEELYKNKRGYWHGDEKCKNLAVRIEKADECEYEGKLYYVLSSEAGNKLITGKNKDKKVSIKGRLYPDERAVEVIEFNLVP